MRSAWLAVLTLLLASCATGPVAATPVPHRDRPMGDPWAANSRGVAPTVEPTPSPVALTSARPASAPSPSLPLGRRLASAQGDFDCDGKPDRLEFFERVGAGPQDAPLLARLVLATGAVHDLALEGEADLSPLIGIADVNGDRCDDAIITVGHGASTTWTSFLVYDGTDLRRVEEDGKPVMFLIGGSVRHGNAIECRRTKDAPEIVARGVSDYTSDYQWDAVEDVHHWSTKTHLVLWSSTRSVIMVSVRYAEPPDSARYWGLSCGNVMLPG